MANVVDTVVAGTKLLLLETDGLSKVGAVNQWVRVRTPDGKEGFCAAWYLEKVSAETPPVVTEPVPSPSNEAPAPTPAPTTPASPSPSTETPAPAPSTPEPEKLKIKVISSVGKAGLRMRKYPSLGGALVKTLKAGTKLTVVEPADRAKAKLGVTGKWIYVREPNGQRGYVSAQHVQLA
jgi:hypothetical protein